MGRTPVSAIAQYAPCTIYVRGQVVYSRIASHVEGQELAKQNQEAASKGRMPHAKPYTSITIKNPVILDNGKLMPQVMQVLQERFYTNKDGILMFSQESKSPFLPTVVYSSLAGDLAGQGIADRDVPLTGELATGLDVTVGVSLFSKNGFAGFGMNYVLINEPIKYYTNTGIAADFAAAGITYVAPTKPATPAYTAPVTQPTTAPIYQQPVQQSTPVTSTAIDPATLQFMQQAANISAQPVAAPVVQQPMVAPASVQDNTTMPVTTTAWEADTPFDVPTTAQQPVQRPVRYY